MTDDRLARVDDVLQAALVRPPEGRETFVREACHDDASLCREVLSLLAHAGSIDKFLESGHDRPLLTPGQTLGRYTVAELIGRGGMGEVYRARDSRPPRDIAIKILPPEFAADPERLLRFEREARAAGTLNHPNIVTIHSVEESGDLRFLTMELVDGQPLSRVIPASGFVLERLLDIAVQLADAVGTAHLGGIVHRDLKPANVMITREGRVKVLDFGLAKLRPLAVAPDLTTTAPGSLSEVGQLLGTIAYMSPEQAEGREVDHRSDVFSLGVVLYELATGNRPFTGDSSVSLLSSILKDTPRPVDDVRPSLPPEFGRIVRRCLMKEPARRYHSAIDVRNQLEELRQDVAAGAAAVRSIAKQGWLPGHDATRKRPRVLRWLAWTGAGVGALAVIALVYLGSRGTLELGWLSRREADGAIVGPVRKTISIPESVTVIQALAISPDGTKLAFTGSGRLWLYDLASEETHEVEGVVGSGPQYPFWSPDGKSIAYFQEGKPGALWRIPAEGGIQVKICDLGKPKGYGGSWNANDTIIFAEIADGLFRVAAGSGVPARITALDSENGERGHRWPNFLPDGRRFTYLAFSTPSAVYLGSLDPNEPRRKLDNVPSRAIGLPGFLLTAGHGTLRARRLTRDGTAVAGEPVPLAQDVEWPSGASGDYLFAASSSVLAYSAADLIRRFQFSIVDRNRRGATAVGQPFLFGNGKYLALSHNGGTVAFMERSADKRRWQIRLLDLASGTATPFTAGAASHVFPIWAPRDDSIAFTKQPAAGTGQDLYVKRLDSGVETRIGESSVDMKWAEDWHPSAGVLFRTETPPLMRRNFWLVGIDTSQAPQLWLKSDANHSDATFSPDGQWVAYASEESGRYEIYVSRFPSQAGKQRISSAGGRFPRWHPNGKSLFFREGDVLMQVDIGLGAAVEPGTPRKVFTLGEYEGYAVHPDGKRFILCTPLDPWPPMTITIVANWKALVKRQ